MTVLLALMLAVSPVVAEPTAWRPDTQQARNWLRSHYHDKYGSHRQWRCVDKLWSSESGWRVRARGPLTKYGRAWGIPQALPGKKMRAFGKDWRTNAVTQVRWGRRYIRSRYGGRPCKALRFQQRRGWY